MKKINFEELMASVSEQFVEEAASFSPIKAFNTRFVALAACIAIIVTAIPAVVILNREKDVDAPKVTTPVEDIVVTPGGEETDKKNTNVIYCESDYVNEDLIKFAFQNEKVEIKNIGNFKKYLFMYNIPGEPLEPDINVPAEMNFTIGEQEYGAILDGYYYTMGSEIITNKELKEGHKVAKYLINKINGRNVEINDNQRIYYSVTAKEIISFNTVNTSSYSPAQLSEKKLLEIVKKDVTDLYGENFLSEHSFEIYTSHKETTALTQGGWKYTVIFDRNFGNIQIDERISLEYNGYGRLIGISTYRLNSFDSIVPKLTQNAIDKAEEQALKILDGRLVDQKRLRLDSQGDVYIYYMYFKKETDPGYDLLSKGSFCVKLNID